jgi:hypothetical protein
MFSVSCDFLLHPFRPDRSCSSCFFSIITSVALTIISGGLYIPFIIAVYWIERNSIPASKSPPMAPTIGSRNPPLTRTGVDLQHLKKKQKEHLGKLEALGRADQWQHIQTHTPHRDSGFDWWMFPIARPSNTYGSKYQLTEQNVLDLKQDSEFMESYRAGILLVAKSWGWDLKEKKYFANTNLRWANYGVRLGKMIDSMQLFGEKTLLTNLVAFIDQPDPRFEGSESIRLGLEGWIQKLLPAMPLHATEPENISSLQRVADLV